jgi:hypothetical protein
MAVLSSQWLDRRLPTLAVVRKELPYGSGNATRCASRSTGHSRPTTRAGSSVANHG